MKLSEHILFIMDKLKERGEVYLVGGYLRDQLLGIIPNDVDIMTSASMDDIKQTFPSVTYTEQGWGVGVCRLTYKGDVFEFSSHPEGELLESLQKRDFTINTLCHNGIELHDLFDAKKAIKQKIIKPQQNPIEHMKERPQAYLRAIRLTSALCFDLDEKLKTCLTNNHTYFYNNSINRIQQEGYQILNTPYPLKAFSLLHDLNLLPKINPFNPNDKILFLSDNHPIRYAHIQRIVGKKPFDAFVSLFSLSNQLIEKVDYYRSIENMTKKTPKQLNVYMILKKYEFNNDKEKIKNFFREQKK